jgi:uncharacterized OB-fold protein
MMAYEQPLPDVNDPLTGPFWAATRESRLAAQQCDQCSAFRWQPAPICPECLYPGGTWTELSGQGYVWSYAVYQRAMHPAFASVVPYTVAMIELDEGIRMVGALVAGSPELAIGTPVQAVFDAVTDEVSLVRWAVRA